MDLQIFGGSGAGSGRKTGGGGRSNASETVNTPSGINYEQLMKMSIEERYDTIAKIIGSRKIKVPDYLDNSKTTKLIYALGMNEKPKVVSDAKLDKVEGTDLYRCVHDSEKPVVTSKEILNEIRTADYTRLSGKKTSLMGKALYFASNFLDSVRYAKGPSSLIMRAKINPNAKMMEEREIRKTVKHDTEFQKRKLDKDVFESSSLYAIAHGLDAWYSKQAGYYMIVNRGVLTISSSNKKALNENGYANSWASSQDA